MTKNLENIYSLKQKKKKKKPLENIPLPGFFSLAVAAFMFCVSPSALFIFPAD